MPKGRRKRVGDFEVGDYVFVNGESGCIISFPTRRVAVVSFRGVTRDVSTLELRKEKLENAYAD